MSRAPVYRKHVWDGRHQCTVCKKLKVLATMAGPVHADLACDGGEQLRKEVRDAALKRTIRRIG